jgi:taurine dioxygenase
LRTAFENYGILVFPQIGADTRFQTYLSEILVGDENVDPDTLECQDEFKVSNRHSEAVAPFGLLLWHNDLTWVPDGCKLVSLYGRQVEQPSVPTNFVSAVHAWNTLPEALRVQVEGQFAFQCQDATAQRRRNTHDVMTATYKEPELVRVPMDYRHPRTGETLLYACPLATHHIDGMDHAQSEPLLEALFDHLYDPQHVYEHHWREGDLVIWDNLVMQHCRPNVEFNGKARVLRKTMVPVIRREQTGLPEYGTVGA